jgi:flagellar hook-basal body complex protein FliE
MIDPVTMIGPEALNDALVPATRASGADFGNWVAQQVDALNRQLVTADTAVRELALGEAGNLHEVMMRLESAKLSLELAVQVRNKVLEAYQELLRMQI